MSLLKSECEKLTQKLQESNLKMKGDKEKLLNMKNQCKTRDYNWKRLSDCLECQGGDVDNLIECIENTKDRENTVKEKMTKVEAKLAETDKKYQNTLKAVSGKLVFVIMWQVTNGNNPYSKSFLIQFRYSSFSENF